MKNLPLSMMIFVALCTSISGCAKIEPWQRQHLASPEMAFDPQPLNKAFREHIYYSREGANGEESAAGGGCGCN